LSQSIDQLGGIMPLRATIKMTIIITAAVLQRTCKTTSYIAHTRIQALY